MQPIPCAHCAINFMRTTPNPEAPKLCNSCLIKEERRNPKMNENLDVISVLIKLPRKIHHDIEESCINQGVDLTKYFLNLYEYANECKTNDIIHNRAPLAVPEKCDTQEDKKENYSRKKGR